MKIVVCIKQVPDTEAEVKWDLHKGTLNREAMDSVTNPFDEFALEEALLTKEKYDAEIVAITMGPAKATDVLRNALALGVDSVYHVTDPAFRRVRHPRHFLCPGKGRRESRRRGTGILRQAGARTATRASWPPSRQPGWVSASRASSGKVVEIDAANKRIKVERGIEGGNELVEAKLPAVVSVLKGINEPRLPNLMGIRKATKIAIPAWDADAIGAAKNKIGVEGSAIKVIELTTPPPRSSGEVLKGER